MTWWLLGLVPVTWALVGEVWSRVGSGRDRVFFVPLPVQAINALPGVTLIRRGLLERWPVWKVWSLRDHEHRHTVQRRRKEDGRVVGWCRWFARYVLSVPWRLKYEADAYARNIVWREARVEGARDELVEAYASHVLGRYFTGFPPWSEAPSQETVERWIRENLP